MPQDDIISLVFSALRQLAIGYHAAVAVPSFL
jgi:hypothetical protein